MRAHQKRILEGPNTWSKQRVIEIGLSREVGFPESIAVAAQRVVAWWTRAEIQLKPNDFAPLAWPLAPIDDAEFLVVLMLNLQRRVGLSVCEGFVKRDADELVAREESPHPHPARPGRGDKYATTRERHGYSEPIMVAREKRFAVEIVDETVGFRAFELAIDLWNAARCGEDFDVASRLRQFSELAFEKCLGQTTGAIVLAAQTCGIPVLRLDEISLVQLGHGSCQHRIQTAVSDRSSFIAEAVSRDKALTKALLKRVGLPVPEGRLVCDEDDAWVAACEFGLPVVVKPQDADYGQGVSLKLTTRAEITNAYREARVFSELVIVERFLEGAHHRLMVVGGKVVAAVRFERAVVVGDGVQTIGELIEEMNRDPRRGARNDSSRPWFLMEIDEETLRVLHSQGSGLEHVPAAFERIVLRFEPRIGWGGGVFDVTDDIHPDVATTVVDAVSMVGLDIAGVDLIANDISRPLEEQNGGLLEVNAGPAILMHLRPFSDPPRPVPEAIVSFLFPTPGQARIPIVSICGDDDENSASLRIAELLKTMHSVVGSATRTGVIVDRRCLCRGPSDDIHGSRMLLLHPRVDAAVIEVSPEHLCNEGLAFDECRIAVLLGDHSEMAGDNITVDDRGTAMMVLLESVQPSGTVIVNLDNPKVAQMALRHGPGVIAISTEATHPMLDRVRQRGGRRVFLRDDVVILGHGSNEFPLFPLGKCNSRHGNGRHATCQTSVRTMMAAVATGWALGIAPELLRREIVSPASELLASAGTQIS